MASLFIIEEKYKWNAPRVYKTFLEYFKKNRYTFIPLSSIVPLLDSTFLFTNTGMNYKDSYYYTFFKMLGNWSFSNYFKKELLTKVYSLDPKRLYITYFKGADRLKPNLEAKELWRSVGGPYRPYSEVYYNYISSCNTAYLINKDNLNVLEIWNVVFILYNCKPDYLLRSLLNKHIDTSIGFKLVTDYVYTLTFIIIDGGGYVIRRVLRRGARYARKYFNTKIGNFFSKVIGGIFLEITKKESNIKEILNKEEESFTKSLDRREIIFKNIDIWRLYNIYGFLEYGLNINNKEVKEKKAAAGLIKLDIYNLGAFKLIKDILKTDNLPKFSRENITAIIKYIYYNKKFLKMLLDLVDSYILYIGVGEEVICKYNKLCRHPIRSNYTNTYILNYALYKILGLEVNQKGLLIAPKKLYFNFSYKSSILGANIAKIKEISTSYIRQNSKVYALNILLATANKTYPNLVRVVSIGVLVKDLLSDKVLVKFYSGTHTKQTSKIKELIILKESGITKGIRRIIAIIGQTALEKALYSAAKEAKVKKMQKAAAKADNKCVLDTITNFFTKEENEAKKYLVIKVKWSTIVNKAISKVIKTVSGKGLIKDKSVYLFSANKEEGKVIYRCYVFKGTNANKVNDGLKKAIKYLKKF
ncbi:alanyl-tRNA synthetase [Cenococcum geophilum]